MSLNSTLWTSELFRTWRQALAKGFEDKKLHDKLHKIQNITQANVNLCNFPLIYLCVSKVQDQQDL